jgi:nucleotide-binding universal stress UspA family protein
MFRTIVVGTNWSDTAEIALVRALELTRAGDAQLHVVTAHDPTLAPVVGGRASPASGPDYQADVVLDRLLERHGAADLDVKQHTATEEPAEAILAVAGQVGADLIIVGNKGMHRRVLGSIPNKVSHRAPCDVLIVQTAG